MDYAWYVAFPISILAGIILGGGIGYLVAQLKIPSFVVTLATFLAFQGLLLLLVGEGGTIRIEDPVILAVENKNLTVTNSWIFFFITAGAYVLSGLWKFSKRRRAGLVDSLFKFWLLKTLILVIIGVAATAALTVERSNNPDLVSLRGIPYVVPVILVLLVGATFVLSRTSGICNGRCVVRSGMNAHSKPTIRVNNPSLALLLIKTPLFIKQLLVCLWV